MAMLLPFGVLVIAAVVLPFAFARLLPEGVAGLLVNGAVSALALTFGTAGYFLWAYGRQDVRVAETLGAAPGETLAHVLGLALRAGLIWVPVLVLSLSAQPRRWKVVQW